MAINEDIRQRANSIRALLHAGEMEAAREAALQLEAVHPSNPAELALVVAVLNEAQRTGSAMIAAERYCVDFPDDSAGFFEVVEMKIARGVFRGETPADMLAAFAPHSFEDRLRTAMLLRKIGHNDQAATMSAAAVQERPQDIEAHRCLVEALNWSQQPRQARKALERMRAVMPQTAYWWAFVAEHSAHAGDRKAADAAARQAEPRLGPADDVPRLMLARGHAAQKDRAGLERILRGWDFSQITADWLLRAIIGLAGQHGLPDLQRAAARQVVHLGNLEAALTQQSRDIIRSYEAFGSPTG